jgi:hypothetical protein
MALKPSALLGFLPTLCGSLLGKQICVDGKALRGTYDKFSMTCGVYVLRAWVREVGLSFAHVNCTEKGNELSVSGHSKCTTSGHFKVHHLRGDNTRF